VQFIAEDPIHVVVRNETPALYDTAGRMVAPARRRVFAKFKRGTAPAHAREIAEKRFEFRRIQQGVEPGQWVAFYDSIEDQKQMEWSDEERQAIEEKLLNHHAAVLIELPRLTPPWPKYDELVATKGGLTNKQVIEKILTRVEEDGYDAAAILAYELENRARKSVIAALQPLTTGEAVDEAELDHLVEEELVEA